MQFLRYLQVAGTPSIKFRGISSYYCKGLLAKQRVSAVSITRFSTSQPPNDLIAIGSAAKPSPGGQDDILQRLKVLEIAASAKDLKIKELEGKVKN